MDDRQNQPMGNQPGTGAEIDPRAPRPTVDDSGEDIDSAINPQGNAGRKGGEAGGFNSADTSDYGTDSSVDTQDAVGIGDADEDKE